MFYEGFCCPEWSMKTTWPRASQPAETCTDQRWSCPSMMSLFKSRLWLHLTVSTLLSRHSSQQYLLLAKAIISWLIGFSDFLTALRIKLSVKSKEKAEKHVILWFLIHLNLAYLSLSYALLRLHVFHCILCRAPATLGVWIELNNHYWLLLPKKFQFKLMGIKKISLFSK